MAKQETHQASPSRKRIVTPSALATYTYVYLIACRYVYGMATSQTSTKSWQGAARSLIWNYATTPAPSSRNSAFASRAYKQVIPDTFTSSNYSDPSQEHTYDGGHPLPAGESTETTNATSDRYYYGFRYYDPATGRWPSRDPIADVGSVPWFKRHVLLKQRIRKLEKALGTTNLDFEQRLFLSGKLDELNRQLTLPHEHKEHNLYSFALNDGVNSIDYLGLLSVEWLDCMVRCLIRDFPQAWDEAKKIFNRNPSRTRRDMLRSIKRVFILVGKAGGKRFPLVQIVDGCYCLAKCSRKL